LGKDFMVWAVWAVVFLMMSLVIFAPVCHGVEATMHSFHIRVKGSWDLEPN
jgi:hypothetical protein